MPIPSDAITFTRVMDPSDLVDFDLTLSQGNGEKDLLQVGEFVGSWQLALRTEAMVAGVILKNDSTYYPALNGLALKVWLEVTEAQRGSTIFDAPGFQAGMELTITTTSSPPRRYQVTLVAGIRNK